MGVEGVKKANLDTGSEIVKPKIELKVEPKKTEILNVDNKNTVVGSRNSESNFVKFKLNAALGDNYAYQGGTTPTVDPEKKADELLNQHGGADDISEDEAAAIGRDIAEIAKTDPAAATAIMTEVQERLKDTDKGDNVASGFVQNSTPEDLEKIAQTPEGKEMLMQIQTNLLTGNVHGNEIREATKIYDAIIAAETSAKPPGTFTTNEGIPAAEAYFTDGTTVVPELEAERIKEQLENGDPYAEDEFLRTLDEHKDDAEWLNRFFKTLGTDASATLINNVGGGFEQRGEAEQAIIGQAFQTMNDAGFLNQSDMDTLVSKMLSLDSYGNTRGALFFTESISNLPNTGNNAALKNMFADTAARIATGKLPVVIESDFKGDILNEMAAMATHTIASTPEANQVRELNRLKTSLGDEGFTDFISKAMNSPKEFYTDSGRTLENFDQVGKLLQTVAASPLASQDLRLDLFEITTDVLGENSGVYDKYQDNLGFKDGLSAIYLKDFDAIFSKNISENGASIKGDTPWLTAFFQMSLFSQPPSSQASDVLAKTYERMASIAKATDIIGSGRTNLTPEEQKLVDDFKRWSPQGANWTPNAAAGVVGEWMGAIDKAYQSAVDDIKGDAAANKAILDVFIGAADKLTGLADLSPGAGLAKDVLLDGLRRYADYREGEEISEGKSKIETTADVIKELNNLIWDTIFEPSQQKYADNFNHITGHNPTENVLGGE